MATANGGTTLTNALTFMQYSPADPPSDFATITSMIFDDRANLWPNLPLGAINPIPMQAQGPMAGALTVGGLLYIPNRGVLQAYPGDRIYVDPVSGWPILVSRTAIKVTGSVWV